MPEGFYQTVGELGGRQGRTDLREWMGYGSKDDEERDAWLASHPTDPLAIDAKKKREKALGKKPAPAASTAGAAALAAAAMRATNGAAASNGSRAPVSAAVAAEPLGMGWWTLGWVGAAIAGMFFLGWLFRSETLTPVARAEMPGVGNAYVLTEACPAGQVPASLIRVLEPGPIINDTEEPDAGEPEE